MNEKVLVADDDPSLRALIEMLLTLEGYTVVIAFNGEDALEAVHDERPSLIILDVTMPGLSGIEVCQRLRARAGTRTVPILMLTAMDSSADMLLGFTSGADDYIIKPFEPIELVARVRSTLERSRHMRDVSPLTGLPGNGQIQQELTERIESGCSLALLHIDLDNFKAFNDHYGFARGDEAIKLAANCCRDAVVQIDGQGGFVGHIGGDDFAVIVAAELAEAVAEEVIKRWERFGSGLFDDDDLERGYIEVPNRRKDIQRFPLVTVSIGVATNRHRPFNSRVESSAIAAEMKEHAKRQQGSNYAIDKRRDDIPVQAVARGMRVTS